MTATSDDSTTVLIKNKMNALNAVIAENNEATQELNKCKIILTALKNVIQKGIPGNPELTERLTSLIATEEAVALCQSIPLLGIEMESFMVDLSAEERNEIKPLLENEIKKVCQKMLNYDTREGYNEIQSDLQAGVKMIPTELNETVKERMKYKLNNRNELLLKLKAIITDLLDLKQKVRSLTEKENSCLSTTCEALELEAKILALQIQKQMYSENSYVVPATKKVSLLIEEEYESTKEELEELKKKKEAYDSLKGTEYEDVLQEYLQIKKELDLKYWALSKIRI